MSTPDRLIMLLFWTSLVVTVTVLPGVFTPWLVAPLLLVAVAATWRLMPAPLQADRAGLLGAGVALVLTLGWIAAHLPYTSRYVTVTRDPGFLTLEGIWLSNHSHPGIPMGSALEVQDALQPVMPELYAWTGAYFPADGVLHAQGAKLLPGLLALGGWVGGETAVLAGNLLLGSLGLLAVYALSRRIVGPLWALLPMAALGASMPMGVFSRAAYTEPVTVAFAFGGLMMSWSAFSTRTWWRHVIAAGMIGAIALVRIDGSAVVIGLIAGMALAAAAPVAPRPRRAMQRNLVLVTLTALALVGLGYLDLRLHSPGYLADLGPRFSMLTAALMATVVVGMALALPPVWTPVRRAALRHRRTLGIGAALLVVVVAAVLTSRPLWFTGNNIVEGSPYSMLVQGLQAREGLEPNPTASYDQNSVTWQSWYFGWPMVVLAFAGLALVAYRAFARRDGRYLVLLAVVAAPSALYLWRVSITPDHIWAMRRFLPLTIPGFLIMATIALAALWAARRIWTRALAGTLAVAVAAHPLTTWGDLYTVPEQGGRWGQLQAVCAGIQGDRALLIRAGGPPYLESLRSACDVEVVELRRLPNQEDLALIRQSWGGTDLDVVAFDEDALRGPDGEPISSLATHGTSNWTYALSHLPREAVLGVSQVWVGTIQEDGSVIPVDVG
ncbi:hypothetical protein [Actinotalea sp. C106]|uniref:hypothetical protein n=1 Tax=Actinotalea sp. C106 TaxID=2908644 RepID=UPI00202881E5|nr:hypothetical protein [Actinotalea sp. C106]